MRKIGVVSLGLFLLFVLGACANPTSETPSEALIESQAVTFVSLGAVNAEVAPSHFALTLERMLAPKITLDKNNYPIVAWSSYSDETGIKQIRVSRWNGSSWVHLGENVVNAFTSIGVPFDGVVDVELIVDATNNPVLAFSIFGFGGTMRTEINTFVRRWNGQQWVTLGNLPRSTSYDPEKPGIIKDIGRTIGLAVDGQNRLIIATSESRFSYPEQFAPFEPIDSKVVVRYWNGTQWLKLVKDFKVVPFSYSPRTSFTIDPRGLPIITFEKGNLNAYNDLYVARWNGSDWTQLGSFLDFKQENSIYDSTLALDKSGTPFVAWIELFFDANGNKVDDNLYVKWWDGSKWVLAAGKNADTAGVEVRNPSLAINSNGRPIVAYDEFLNGNRNIYVKYLTGGNTWSYLGAQLDVSLPFQAAKPAIRVDSNGETLIVWGEFPKNVPDTGNLKFYVKKTKNN